MTQFEMFITLYIMGILLLITVFVSHCALSKEHCEIKNEIQKLKEVKGDTDEQNDR